MRKISIKDLVCEIENSIFNLPREQEEKFETRMWCSDKNAKWPKYNIYKDETIVFKNMRESKEIKGIKVDKGNSTIIMNKLNYEDKMLEHPLNNKNYKEISRYLNNKAMK